MPTRKTAIAAEINRGRRSRSSKEPLLTEFRRACGMAAPLRFLIQAADGGETEHTVDRPFALLGRARACDIVLPSREIAPRHVLLQSFGDRAFCIDLGSRAGTRMNGDRRASGWLEAGEQIQLGDYTVYLQPMEATVAGAPSPEENRDGPTALEIRATIWTVPDGVSLIGRASPCTLRGADLGLATYHASVIRVAGQLWIVDLRSGKRTRVNGRAVRFGRLRDGDMIEAGGWSAIARVEAPQPSRVLVQAPQTSAAAGGALAPFQQMMEHFHQCVLMMGDMFTSFQQQHMAMVREQIGQLRDVTRELLDRRAVADEIPWAADVPIDLPSPNDRPTPKLSASEETPKLRHAHVWFTDQLSHQKKNRRR